jgi:hypothetical protein
MCFENNASLLSCLGSLLEAPVLLGSGALPECRDCVLVTFIFSTWATWLPQDSGAWGLEPKKPTVVLEWEVDRAALKGLALGGSCLLLISQSPYMLLSVQLARFWRLKKKTSFL